jgi:hypothetical protein
MGRSSITDLLEPFDLRVTARRALAFAHAAIDRPTTAGVREARRLLSAVLRAVEGAGPIAEVVDLGRSLRQMLNTVLTLEARVALS